MSSPDIQVRVPLPCFRDRDLDLRDNDAMVSWLQGRARPRLYIPSKTRAYVISSPCIPCKTEGLWLILNRNTAEHGGDAKKYTPGARVPLSGGIYQLVQLAGVPSWRQPTFAHSFCGCCCSEARSLATNHHIKPPGYPPAVPPGSLIRPGLPLERSESSGRNISRNN